MLGRGPNIAELPGEQRAVAIACINDTDPDLRARAERLMPAEEWQRVQAAVAEFRRQAEEAKALRPLCHRGDEASLRAMLPGHAAFYDLVCARPALAERPVDAVITIGISGNLVSKAKKILQRDMASEALEVQLGGSGHFSPNRYATRVEGFFFHGYYTAEIETRMAAPRPDCKRYRNTPYIQSACRLDLSLSIADDWMAERGHKSARFLISNQSSWPRLDILCRRLLPHVEMVIDPNFDRRISPRSTFLHAVCGPKVDANLWIDYDLYVRCLEL